MPREDKKDQPKGTPKTNALSLSDQLMEEVMFRLCREDTFPKRSRWLFSGKIADLTNDYLTQVHLANEIRVITREDRDARHHHLTMAIAYLMALDCKVNQAQRCLNIPEEKLHVFSELVLANKEKLEAWKKSDTKRFGPPTSLTESRKAGEEFISAMLLDFKQLFRAWAGSVKARYDGSKEPVHTQGDDR